MLFFSFETPLSSDEIRERCTPYLESEPHTSWNLFEEYTSARTGIHLYFTQNGFKCYYENGETDRTDSLQSAKAWGFARIEEKNGTRRIYGCTLFCPLLILFLLYGLIELIFTKEALSFGMLFILCGIFFISAYKEERAIVQQLKRMFPPRSTMK